MSVFSPSSWMPHRNRTRVHSNNSADFSKDEETLQGLRFTSPKLMTPPRNVREEEYTPPISNRSTFDLDLRIPVRSNGNSHSAQKDLTTNNTNKNRATTRHVRNQSAPIYNNKNMHMPLTLTSNPEEFQMREFRDEFENETNLFRQIFDSEDMDNHHDPAMDVQDFSVEVYHECLNDIAEIKRTGSGGEVSVISCLTNDDTHTPVYFDEPQDKDGHGHGHRQSSSGSGAHAIAIAPTVPSQGLRLPAVPVMTRPTRPKPLHARAATVGKDFGSVFDHLVREDKLDKYLNGHETKRKQHHQQQQQIKDKRGPGSFQTSRPNRRPANLARPQNLAHHSRCQSDTMAYRPKTSSSYSHPNKGHFRSPSNIGSTSAHATLREKLTCTMDDSPSLNLLFLKPQIVMSRSTSNTAQSTSGGTASSGMSELEVKAAGQVAGPSNVNDSVSATHSNGSRHYRRHSSGFGTNDATVFSLPEESVPENSAVSMPRTKAEEEPGSFSQILVQNQHGGFLNGRIRFDDKDSKGGEEEVSSRVEDKSVASSDSRFTSGRNILKDEFKFMIGRIVPWPIKKVAQMARRKPKLTRSEGCLT